MVVVSPQEEHAQDSNTASALMSTTTLGEASMASSPHHTHVAGRTVTCPGVESTRSRVVRAPLCPTNDASFIRLSPLSTLVLRHVPPTGAIPRWGRDRYSIK